MVRLLLGECRRLWLLYIPLFFACSFRSILDFVYGYPKCLLLYLPFLPVLFGLFCHRSMIPRMSVMMYPYLACLFCPALSFAEGYPQSLLLCCVLDLFNYLFHSALYISKCNECLAAFPK